MGRGPKPAKSREAKVPVTRKARKNDIARVQDLEKRLAEALQRETEGLRRGAEALEQQAATAEILRVIGASPTDEQPVFDAIASSAARLCESYDVAIRRLEGDGLRLVAHHGPIPASALIPVMRGSVSGRAVLERQTVHVVDIQGAVDEFPEGATLGREAGVRTNLGIPLLQNGLPLGAIVMRRAETKPFSDTQIALLQTFADQAVIAIENVRLFNETKEALEQQTATSEILNVISASPTDVHPVFAAICKSAVRLFGAYASALIRFDGQLLHFGAVVSPSAEADERYRLLFPRPLEGELATGRAILDRAVVHVPDTESDTERNRELGRAFGYRRLLVVPMMRGGEAIGALAVTGREPGSFSNRQIELLQTFADQAVIAIENVRLFNELQSSNRELTTALDQQKATSEILGVISRSPTDIQPVFDAIVRSAARLCDADDAQLLRVDGEILRLVASYGTIPGEMTRPIISTRVAGRAVIDRRAVHVHDLQLEHREFPDAQPYDIRSMLSLPLLREGRALGVVQIRRTEVRPFNDAQIALLETFADQAVIAIENVRLFKELQQKNEALTVAHAQVTESLEQQTATAEILRVISRSQADARPVFEAIAENATRLFRAWAVQVYRLDGQRLHLEAARGGRLGLTMPEWAMEQEVSRASYRGRSILDRVIVHVQDVLSDPNATERARDWARADGWRSVINAPMLRDSAPIGLITVYRLESGGYLPTEIELLKTFADQAVIAVENARLLAELRARTDELQRSVEQLTALGEVGRAVSSSLDLETVLNTIVARAVQLAGAHSGTIWEYDAASEEFVLRITQNVEDPELRANSNARVRRGEGAVGRLAINQRPVQIPDITHQGAYEGRLRDSLVGAGTRALLAIPLLHEDQLLGGLVISRRTPGAFPAEVVDLLASFATQSALALQNARLFLEIEDKSRQLEAASQHKSEFLANMSHELRTPLNAIIGFSEVLSEKMFGELNEKQEEYLKDIYASGTHLLSLINDILDLSKIEAGRMELELSDFHLPTALDSALTLVRERAGRRGIALQMNVDSRLAQIQADERKVRQVVLNLLSNAIKFTPEGGRIDVAAVAKDGAVEVSVSDTGVGIAPEDQQAVFEEFRQVGTADKKVEGTGLGLTLCRKFVELHGGRIWVKSQVGEGSTFTFTVPVR